ncbi:GGDEF domain-containing protein [Acidaminobacter sp. JC074]|uniref:GGDEF domain-containing protein n=1 Tax=Acidaminobacter sp. JC074 TaxID=2530199 RepID=UPI001F10746F|nr:GGDEF domain-containing protein [Acidaminobacter sp. JC074]MCH4889542.1 GGDEF domain-containing protein [Acidaminobacter sp. JC074]
MFKELFFLDSKSMIGILIWMNISLSLITWGYHIKREVIVDKQVLALFSYAKFFQGLAWFLMFERAFLSMILSRYLANSLLFIGFFIETIVMFKVVRELSRKNILIQTGLLIIALAVFNFMPREIDSSIYVVVASAITLAIFVYPTTVYSFRKNQTAFVRFIGVSYLMFCIVMVLRMTTSYFSQTHLFSINLVQHLSFILLILLATISGPGFLLIQKEQTDLQLKNLANLDDLTKISNRRYFMNRADQMIAEHARYNQVLSLVFIDIDNFKQVNDVYGHHFGDEVLKHLAGILKGNIRGDDLACRYGGEEFVIMLSDTDLDGAIAVVNHIRDHIRKERLSIEDFSYTISVGIHSQIPDENELYSMIKKSDEAMYKAKQAGKNRYVVFKESYD